MAGFPQLPLKTPNRFLDLPISFRRNYKHCHRAGPKPVTTWTPKTGPHFPPSCWSQVLYSRAESELGFVPKSPAPPPPSLAAARLSPATVRWSRRPPLVSPPRPRGCELVLQRCVPAPAMVDVAAVVDLILLCLLNVSPKKKKKRHRWGDELALFCTCH